MKVHELIAQLNDVPLDSEVQFQHDDQIHTIEYLEKGAMNTVILTN